MHKFTRLSSLSFVVATALLPLATAAQDSTRVTTIINNTRDVLNLVIVVLFIIATIYFIWGVIQYIMGAGDEAAQTKAKNTIIWGVIALAAISAAWGIAQVLVNFFGVGGQGIPAGLGTLR